MTKLKRRERCETCKYWEEGAGSYSYKDYGACTSPKTIDDNENNERPETDDCLISFDYESYKSYIQTGRNFGCTHWREI